MDFYIQVCNPEYSFQYNDNDVTLSDAIESAFLLNTENAIMVWNHINIPLSYKYDVSYMMEDILHLLNLLKNAEKGNVNICWLPDTFRSDWKIEWNNGKLCILSQWESVVGNLEIILNANSKIVVDTIDFRREWKELLYIVIQALVNCGYDKKKIEGMKNLVEQYEDIDEKGILYRR